MDFKDSKVFKVISERWGGGKDMEQYFVDCSKEALNKLKNEIK